MQYIKKGTMLFEQVNHSLGLYRRVETKLNQL